MQNSNEKMRREFERDYPASDWVNGNRPPMVEQIYAKAYQAAHTSAAEKYKGLVDAAKGMLKYALHNESWQDDHPEYVDALRQALANLGQQE